MKILVYCTLPFALAHGGQAIQIQQTMAALAGIGVEVEPQRWWDETQTGDLILYFGRMPAHHILFAHQKGIKVVISDLLTAQGSQTLGQGSVVGSSAGVRKTSRPMALPRPFNGNPTSSRMVFSRSLSGKNI